MSRVRSIVGLSSPAATRVWLASVFTSEATTAKPRPASPARAASIPALSASILVRLAMSMISASICSIDWLAAFSAVVVRQAEIDGFDPVVVLLGQPAHMGAAHGVIRLHAQRHFDMLDEGSEQIEERAIGLADRKRVV